MIKNFYKLEVLDCYNGQSKINSINLWNGDDPINGQVIVYSSVGSSVSQTFSNGLLAKEDDSSRWDTTGNTATVIFSTDDIVELITMTARYQESYAVKHVRLSRINQDDASVPTVDDPSWNVVFEDSEYFGAVLDRRQMIKPKVKIIIPSAVAVVELNGQVKPYPRVYYVDPSAAVDGTGTSASPFKVINDNKLDNLPSGCAIVFKEQTSPENNKLATPTYLKRHFDWFGYDEKTVLGHGAYGLANQNGVDNNHYHRLKLYMEAFASSIAPNEGMNLEIKNCVIDSSWGYIVGNAIDIDKDYLIVRDSVVISRSGYSASESGGRFYNCIFHSSSDSRMGQHHEGHFFDCWSNGVFYPGYVSSRTVKLTPTSLPDAYSSLTNYFSTRYETQNNYSSIADAGVWYGTYDWSGDVTSTLMRLMLFKAGNGDLVGIVDGEFAVVGTGTPTETLFFNNGFKYLVGTSLSDILPFDPDGAVELLGYIEAADQNTVVNSKVTGHGLPGIVKQTNPITLSDELTIVDFEVTATGDLVNNLGCLISKDGAVWSYWDGASWVDYGSLTPGIDTYESVMASSMSVSTLNTLNAEQLASYFGSGTVTLHMAYAMSKDTEIDKMELTVDAVGDWVLDRTMTVQSENGDQLKLTAGQSGTFKVVYQDK